MGSEAGPFAANEDSSFQFEPSMRRRNLEQDNESPNARSRSMYRPSWAQRVQTADMFTKVDRRKAADIEKSSITGGIVSVLCYTIMAVLFIWEFAGFIFPTRSEHLKVDTSRMQTTEIDFHITFPSICCADVHIDTMDATGEQQVNVVQSVYKQRLDSSGDKIGREFIDRDASPKLFVQMPGFGLMALVGTDHRIAEQRAGKEGCSARGILVVNKVEGNFHIAVGRSHKSQGHHVHNFRISDIPHFNTSHIIHHVNFGQRYSGQSPNPLSSWTRIIPASDFVDTVVTGTYQYHIELTPTIYVNSLGRRLHTNQISVRDYFRILTFPSPDGVATMPGIFFQWKYSPFMVQVDDRRTSFFSFLLSTCAIIGGVFAVSELINNLIQRFHSMFGGSSSVHTPKYELL